MANGIPLNSPTRSRITEQLIAQALAAGESPNQVFSTGESLARIGSTGISAWLQKQLMQKDAAQQQQLADVLLGQLGQGQVNQQTGEEMGPPAITDPTQKLIAGLLENPETQTVGSQIGLQYLLQKKEKEPRFTDVVKLEDGTVLGVNKTTGGTDILREGKEIEGLDDNTVTIWNQAGVELPEFTTQDGVAPLATFDMDDPAQATRAQELLTIPGVVLANRPSFQQPTPAISPRKQQENQDALESTQDLIGRLGALREDITRNPAATSPRGALVETASPYLALISGDFANSVSRVVAGGDIQDVQRIRTEAQELVTKLVPLITEEDRFTDRERDEVKKIAQASKTWTTAEQATAATSTLMALGLGDENWLRMKNGQPPLFPSLDTDDGLNIAGQKLVEHYRMSPEEALDTLEILEWQWRARNGNATN